MSSGDLKKHQYAWWSHYAHLHFQNIVPMFQLFSMFLCHQMSSVSKGIGLSALNFWQKLYTKYVIKCESIWLFYGYSYFYYCCNYGYFIVKSTCCSCNVDCTPKWNKKYSIVIFIKSCPHVCYLCIWNILVLIEVAWVGYSSSMFGWLSTKYRFSKQIYFYLFLNAIGCII